MLNLIISKLLLPLSIKGLEVLVSFITRLAQDWLEERKEDQTDRTNREGMKNPAKGEVARDLNRGFE